MQRDVLTVLETASALNLHPETVKRFCRIGKLKGEKASVGWLIPKDDSPENGIGGYHSVSKSLS